MSWKIGMPNLGHTMEEGTVAEWLKKVGDTVAKGEIVAIVESDKASFDVESPADGTLLAIEVPGGTVVPVGTTIGLVGVPGESIAKADDIAPGPAAASRTTAATAAVPAQATASASPGRATRVRISPAARALAEELGVEPADVTPTGDDDMITRDDVREHAAAMSSKGPANRPAGASSAAKALSPMRRAIAEATARSWQTIPQVALRSHADIGALVDNGGVSLTAAVARATALALVEHPAFNGWLEDNAFEQSEGVNLAFAVTTPDGLVAAVVPDAETKSIDQLREEIQELAVGAKTGRLSGSRMLGGSFTVSSLGRWGVDSFEPIIAAPQVAILGVGGVDRVAREAPGGKFRFASEIQLTLVFDHRANDGVEAARLLASIVACLEDPQRLEIRR